ncbi:ribosomal protein S6 kinase-related protein isoform X5 [Chelonia mydas]|uniref:ribosomal protein S6 kinase-related protein isoform X5 n=1 Tax=Chelonia mydas TaxID=8469 RepID=UPI001CA8DB77|nr:ribosomal protein S6 kinase-related protein isoform X5 [Chelonia mydas]
MGAASSEPEPPPGPLKGGGLAAQVSWVRTWKSVLAGIGVTVSGLERNVAARRRLQPQRGPGEKLPRLGEKVVTGWPVPQFVSLFLPEFPIRPPLGQQQLKILGFVAKGSFGTVLKVLDCGREKVFAVKVVPKVEVLRRDTLKQCKEEVSIQRQVSHPFVHCLGDSWQGQRHLFIMCTYCSTGDLYALWASSGRFAEATIRLFAAELVLVLGYLHDLGIVHRDVKMENILLDERGHLKLTDFGLSRHLRRGERAYTICGTLQYMVPGSSRARPPGHAGEREPLQLREPELPEPGAVPPAQRAPVPKPPAAPALPPPLQEPPLLPGSDLGRRAPAEAPSGRRPGRTAGGAGGPGTLRRLCRL